MTSPSLSKNVPRQMVKNCKNITQRANGINPRKNTKGVVPPDSRNNKEKTTTPGMKTNDTVKLIAFGNSFATMKAVLESGLERTQAAEPVLFSSRINSCEAIIVAMVMKIEPIRTNITIPSPGPATATPTAMNDRTMDQIKDCFHHAEEPNQAVNSFRTILESPIRQPCSSTRMNSSCSLTFVILHYSHENLFQFVMFQPKTSDAQIRIFENHPL